MKKARKVGSKEETNATRRETRRNRTMKEGGNTWKEETHGSKE